MDDIYKTIKAKTEGIFKDKGSKFLSFAIPVRSVDEVKELIREYRKEYYDARHVCYAYVLGAERDEFRANDDGEPSGTAGRPVLGQINSKELTDVLVVVIRYFGGILLGTSGLINAYKEAAKNVLEQAEVVEKTVDCTFMVRFEYPLMNEIMRVIKEIDAQILSQNYETDCIINLSIRKSNVDMLLNKLGKINGAIVSRNSQ
jgi:uncharacterized YigZ family protein